MTDRDTVELELTVCDETAAAYAVQNPAEDAPWRNWIWLPKSQVELSEPYRGGGATQTIDIEMPEWLAMEKGLL